jgi:ABC-type glutathione transport system ATPase component
MITVKHRLATAQPHLARLLSITARAWGLSAAASSHSFRVHRSALLKVPRSEIFGAIGRSGAGKSSLARSINRLNTVSLDSQ